MEPYKTIRRKASAEFVERKSRFIGTVCPVTTPAEATAFIEELKTKEWQATHNCWAYNLRENMAQRYSDNGEPQGTAGVPILEVLRKEELFDAVIVVTRYFGGIMLGAGGLIRAYSQAAKIALDAGERVMMVPCDLLELTLPYPLYDRFLSASQVFPMEIIDTQFAQDVTLQIRLQQEYTAELTRLLTEFSAGSITPIQQGTIFAPVQL